MTTEILNNQIDAVQSMQTYIEDHLAESISLTDLSRIAHFSPWYCSRIFKESTYVQGVEVPSDYDGEIPSGFSVLMLPAAKYLMFQGEPFEEENYCEAIDHVHNSINQYDPSILGYTWDEKNPRIQLEPIGRRGYIELKAIK